MEGSETPGSLEALAAAQQRLHVPDKLNKLRDSDQDHRLTVLAWFADAPVCDAVAAVAANVWDRLASRRSWRPAGSVNDAWRVKDEALGCLYLAIRMVATTVLEDDEEPSERDMLLTLSGAPKAQKASQWQRIDEAEKSIMKTLNFSSFRTSHLEIAIEIAAGLRHIADCITAVAGHQWAGFGTVEIGGKPWSRHRILVGYLVELAFTHIPQEVYAAPAAALGIIAALLALKSFPWHPVVPQLNSRLAYLRERFASNENASLEFQHLEVALLGLWRRDAEPCFVRKKWLARGEANNFVAMLAPPAPVAAEPVFVEQTPSPVKRSLKTSPVKHSLKSLLEATPKRPTTTSQPKNDGRSKNPGGARTNAGRPRKTKKDGRGGSRRGAGRKRTTSQPKKDGRSKNPGGARTNAGRPRKYH